MAIDTIQEKKVAEEMCRLLELYRSRRKPHEDRWQELAEYLIPDREILMKGIDHKGTTTHSNVYDDIGTHCLQVWADGIMGNTASPGFKWIRFMMEDREINKVPEVKSYLQDYDEQMYAEFKNGALYKALGMFLRDLGSIGTAHCYAGDRLAGKAPLYKMFHPVEVFIGENWEGEIDLWLIEQYITVRNLVNYFGEDKAGENRVKQAKNKPTEEVRILWAVVPREERIDGLLHAKHKKYASFHIDIEQQTVLMESGYDEPPVVSARCILDSGEEYGRSPGSNAIRDVKMANLMSKTNLIGAQRLVDPPTDAPIERRGQLSWNPGAHNYYERSLGPNNAYPLLTHINLPAGVDILEKLEERVKRHFFYDFFLSLLLEQKAQTAYEVAEKMGERAVVLAPIIFQYLTEGLDKFVYRTAAIAGRAGRLPPIPDVLREAKGSLDVEYLGPLAQAQRRLFKTQGIVGFMQTVAGVPSQEAILDRANWDEIVEDLADAHGVPEKDVRTDQEVEQIREQRAKVQQAMQQAELAKSGAQAAAGMAKRPEAGSPLEQLMVGAAGSGA
ncbi:MAG: portal protein [Anaerolineae bacterium]|jgi:hypothetical protein|nr:portal protein [Anaerolineae bacterium]